MEANRHRIAAGRPVGTPTRGTTATNRLRRIDRFLTGPLSAVLRDAEPWPVVVDLGYGGSPATAVELHHRLRRIRRDIRLAGIEIDQHRVDLAAAQQRADRAFLRGGFEVPLPQGWPDPMVIRAFNVLRQYRPEEVPATWDLLTGRLACGGVVIEGTCDEQGRVASWITLRSDGPVWFTISLRLRDLDRPGVVAERLPKALIHHNTPGTPINHWLTAVDRSWEHSASLIPFGPRQRWLAAVARLVAEGHPILHGASRWRLGEVTVPWESVRPD